MNSLVIGGAVVDHVGRPAQVLLSGTSNPGQVRTTAGGVGRNIAEGLARLGHDVRLLAPVAEDRAGSWLAEGLDRVGVRLERLPADHTGSYTAILDHNGELHAAVSDLAATDALDADAIPSAAFDGVDWVVLDGNLPAAALARCLILGREAGARVLLDPVSVAKAARLADLLGPTLPLHTLTPNTDELAALSGTRDVTEGVARLHQRGVENVWLRSGADGSVLFARARSMLTVPAHPATPRDVTGAGDAMLAAYLHGLIGGVDLRTALEYGAVAAALTIAVDGAVRRDLDADLLQRTHDERPKR